MLLNSYYYLPHNHCLLSRHLDWDLEKMASLGTDIVSLCVAESHLGRWYEPRLREVVRRIHHHGMKVHAVPNRWAGLVAGWLDGFDRFSIEHAGARCRDANGGFYNDCELACCVHHPEVRRHVTGAIQTLLDKFDIDGLIWDEPHDDYPCHCAYCRELCPGVPDEVWHRHQVARFIDDCSGLAKRMKPGLAVSLFVQPHQEALLRALLDTKHIDYLGSDGHIRSDDHRMHRMKGTIFQAHARFFPILQSTKRKSLFLLEAQRHRDEDLENYLANIEHAFRLPMDHLMYYYSAHEMSHEKAVIFTESTWRVVGALKSRL